MDLRDTPEEAAFRAELRSWLEENLPEGIQGNRGGAARFDGPGDARVEPRALRRRLRGAHLARGVRRRRRAVHAPGDLPRGAGARRGAAAHRRHRDRDGRADDHRARHRGAEGALPRAAPLRGGDLVPGLLRARRGLRPRRRADELDARRRALRRQRPEGVVVVRPPRRLLHPRSRAPTPSRAATRGSRTSSSTCTRRASRCGRSGRSPARRSSTRSSSPTCVSPPRTSSARSAAAGRSR